ncbi:hypothetical protein BO78DRAFT_419657 [Aspergillus sclerotiicarbonarius CBS 121057]|uniref:Tat pathway signal sequence n=1 Tax=Aspergillus sclerotiicarbonarius (strain CBS 121057 / IBT 28362) TaxID=1448318 RepID=A0A319E5Q7_ASPSB|nr:hypothetical protein BO78DRAFT_419657 [Aspergillus sclerotiicarbonarius CBS 121057]
MGLGKYMRVSKPETGRDSEDGSDLEGLLHDPQDAAVSQPTKAKLSSVFHWTVHVITIILIFGLYVRSGRQAPRPTPLSIYSPLVEAVGDTSRMETFKGTFWESSPYHGPPTDEVMAAWKHITHIPLLNFTAEEISRMGHSLDSVQYPLERGGGYVAQFEAIHQLHCLHSLWQDHHYQKHPEMFPDLTESINAFPDVMEEHYEHCVNMLRQRLMCTPDPNFVTWRWVEGITGPYADFNTPHVCQDYEALLEWGHGRAVDAEVARDFYSWVPPADAVRLSHAP